MNKFDFVNSTKNIKIGYVCFSLAGGGAEKNAINLVSHLNKRRYCLIDLILVKNINDYRDQIKKVQNINVIPLLTSSAKIPSILYPIKIIETVIKLLVIARKNNYDVLIGGIEYFPYHLTIVVGGLLGIKKILVVGNNLPEHLRKYSYFWRIIHFFLLKISFYLADSIICVSKGIAYGMEKKFLISKDKIITIYNGIDIERTNISKTIKEDLIVNIGRLVPQKGHVHLIRSFYEIKKLIPGIKLSIIGKGTLKQSLKELMAKLGLQDDVTILGFTDNPHKHLHKAKIFVSPSLYEGFGNALVEAMACGVPVISTDCPYGPREILSSNKVIYPLKPINNIAYCKYGILVPAFGGSKLDNKLSREEKLLAKAVISLLGNQSLLNKYSQLGKKRANDFTMDKMGEQYIRVIKVLVCQR